MYEYDRTLNAYFTLAAELRPESTALGATGLVAPDPFDRTGRWARTETGGLDVCVRDLEAGAADRGQWAILSHPRYPRSVLVEANVPAVRPDVDPLEQVPNAQLWPVGVVEHDPQAGSRYWVYTGPELEDGGWVATDAADAFFQERCGVLTSYGWETASVDTHPAAAVDQQTWADRWCIVATAEAALAASRQDLFFAVDAAGTSLAPPPGDDVALHLWDWTAGWATEQLERDFISETTRKNAEARLARVDAGLVRDYLRHAATAPAHVAMATAVGARLDTAPGSDFELLARLEERAQRLWSAGANASEGYDRWVTWRQGLDVRQQELANQPLHLALERHSHPGPSEQVITRPARRQHQSGGRAKTPVSERGSRAHRGGGRGR